MGWFGSSKDWNVLAVLFERDNLFRVNAQRCKGSKAVLARDGAKEMSRTIFWAVFDQTRQLVESGPGKGSHLIESDILLQLRTDLPKLMSITDILESLETKSSNNVSKSLVWNGYPKKKTEEK